METRNGSLETEIAKGKTHQTKLLRKDKKMAHRTVKELIETVRSLETLEYYNKNYLSIRYATSPADLSQEKIDLLNLALDRLSNS